MSLSIAFIGTGVMGVSMAGHLQRAGHALRVHNRTRGKAEALVAAGATWHESAGAAAKGADIVITTAAIPGRRAPLLVTKETVAMMRPGAVIVDLAAESGGNCELTQAGKTVREGGVTIIGPQNLPARVPFHSSQMYAKNLQSFLGLLADKDGVLVQEFSDEILVASLLVHAGEVRHGPTRDLLNGGKP